jgi:hypothetical protein
MAIPALAARAGQVAVKYAPVVYEKAKNALSAVTAGQVQAPEQIVSYVGNSPQRLKIAAEALVRSGVDVNDVLPRDLIGSDKTLQQIRSAADKIAGSLQAQFASGSDKTLNQGGEAIAADALRRTRVEAALSVYGSGKRYFLCHPNGGIPAEDFAWYDAVIARRPR